MPSPAPRQSALHRLNIRSSRQGRGAFEVIAFLGAYILWMALFRLLALSLITYLVTASGSTRARFDEVNDAYSSAELIVLGLGSLGFTALLALLHPLVDAGATMVFDARRWGTKFFPNFVHGTILAAGLAGVYMLCGNYRYLGSFFEYEESQLALGALGLKLFSLGALVTCEEFVFRHWIRNRLGRSYNGSAAIGITSVLYTWLKCGQFGLGWMQGISVFLASVALGLRARREGHFLAGAGFWAAILIVFHPVLSLPIFGNDSSGGFFLVKYQSGGQGHLTEAIRFISGGPGGPIASFGFQLLMIFEILRELRVTHTQARF